MIRIGLAGWGDQAALYPKGLAARDKLKVYAEHFPIVEVDSSFYAIPSVETVRRWAEETPSGFGFIVKAFQAMTGHARGAAARDLPEAEELFRGFLAALAPLREAGKLRAALLQYPPWFDCSRKHVELLREAKTLLGDTPAALEFRHQSWFAAGMRERTLAFMEREGWMHSVCDEPQAGPGSVPIVAAATDARLTVVRMHGRNTAGWSGVGRPDADWREVRYLYRYNDEELAEWADRLRGLEGQSREVCVIFNNNSGGDAAGNAKRMMELLGQQPAPFPPQQLELFD